VTSYFEEIWAQVPPAATPERFALRRDFVRARVARGERVLDLGCGEGDFTAALAAVGAKVVGVDVAAEPLRRARLRFPGLEFVQVSDALPFACGAFDVVWAGEVLEHVQDGLGLLAQIARVLAPAGRLLVSTPDHGAWRRLSVALSRRRFETCFDPRSDHLRFFTAGSLRSLLAAAGFDDAEVRSARGSLLASAQRR
jgi:2-polyprenyl-6-hydroxyphenyl methylase/3-demethylubiquinone-9 3-methyltransferase